MKKRALLRSTTPQRSGQPDACATQSLSPRPPTHSLTHSPTLCRRVFSPSTTHTTDTWRASMPLRDNQTSLSRGDCHSKLHRRQRLRNSMACAKLAIGAVRSSRRQCSKKGHFLCKPKHSTVEELLAETEYKFHSFSALCKGFLIG